MAEGFRVIALSPFFSINVLTLLEAYMKKLLMALIVAGTVVGGVQAMDTAEVEVVMYPSGPLARTKKLHARMSAVKALIKRGYVADLIVLGLEAKAPVHGDRDAMLAAIADYNRRRPSPGVSVTTTSPAPSTGIDQ